MISKKFFGEGAVDNSQRVFDLVMRLTCISMLFVFAYGWRRYAPGYQIMNQAPLIESLTHLPDLLNWAVLFLCSASFAFLLFIPQNRIAAQIILPCMIFFVLQDFNRLQPFVFMYMFPIVIVALFKEAGERGVNALRFMVCGIYFWAGFHKLNMSFYMGTFPWFVSPIYKLFANYPSPVIDVLFAVMTFITPFFEALIGILLMFPKWRRVATFMASIMLATVLFCLGPFGHNWGQIVWPWNVYLFSLEYLLFFSFAGDKGKSLLSVPMTKVSVLSIAVYVVAPVLAIFTHWYAYTGYKLYSANIVTGKIILGSNEALNAAPDYIKKIVKQNNTIGVIELFGAERSGAPYPVPYVLKTSTKGLCKFLDNPKDAILRINYPPPFYKIKGTDEDSELCHD
jgi:uncharacterized membrane protein YphA (DoxX/SURF4 family)